MSSVTIHFTADLHGRVGPSDPLTGAPSAGGLARAATLLREARGTDPEAIYLDLGDLVQGSPMSYFHVKERPDAAHPLVRALNELGCAGLVVGNHEFNFGLGFLESLRRTARFPLLAANVLGPGGEPFFEPFLRVERGGKSVVILAVTTPQVPRWEEPWNYEGLTFHDAVETVRQWMPRLRPECDALVVAAHMGWDGVTDGGLENPVPHENDVGRMLAQIDDIDVVLMAHTHQIDERRGDLGTLAVQPGAGGEAVGEVRLRWSGEDRPVATARIHAATLETPPDPGVLGLVSADLRRAEESLGDVIGTATAPFSVDGIRYRDNAMLTLMHKVQLEFSGADLSTAALFREEGLEAGPVTVRDLFRVYPFENDLTILELTVQNVRDYLEQIAEVYLGPSCNGAPPPVHPEVRLYNHDAIAGAEYRIDPSRPVGQRVTELTFHGEELPADTPRTLALTSYRAQGGGGYRALRRGRVIERTGREMRVLFIDFVREHGEITPEVFGNWAVEGGS